MHNFVHLLMPSSIPTSRLSILIAYIRVSSSIFIFLCKYIDNYHVHNFVSLFPRFSKSVTSCACSKYQIERHHCNNKYQWLVSLEETSLDFHFYKGFSNCSSLYLLILLYSLIDMLSSVGTTVSIKRYVFLLWSLIVISDLLLFIFLTLRIAKSKTEVVL